MGKIKTTGFLDGIAWTMAILAGYGLLRFGFVAIHHLTEPIDTVVGTGGPIKSFLEKYAFGLSIVHVLVSAVTLAGAIALLWRRKWSRIYFSMFFLIFGIYLGLYAYATVFEGDHSGEGIFVKIKLAFGFTEFVLAILSILLGYFFQKPLIQRSF